MVTGAVGQVELDVVWNGLVLFDFKVNWSAEIDTVGLGDFVRVVIVSVGFDRKVLAELKGELEYVLYRSSIVLTSPSDD